MIRAFQTLVTLCVFVSSVWADAVLIFPDTFVQPESSSEQVEIFVRSDLPGGEYIDAMTLIGAISDTGAPSSDFPTIVDMDVQTGTVFEGITPVIGPNDIDLSGVGDIYPSLEGRTLFTGGSTAFLPGSGDEPALLATLTLDTTGLFMEDYSLEFLNLPAGMTSLIAGVPPDVSQSSGVLMVVPEPSTLTLLLVLTTLIPCFVGRRR